MEITDLPFASTLGIVIALLLLITPILLLMIRTNRLNRHRAELAEARLVHDREVMDAELEATRHTLREVGRELHDNIGQLLTVAQLELNTVLEGPSPNQRVDSAREALEQGIEEIRRMGRDLNTDHWQHHGLVDTIFNDAQRLERVGRIKAPVLVNGIIPQLPADKKTILYRVFQEIVSNAMEHGGADSIEVTMSGQPRFTLHISDNGCGFDEYDTGHQAGLMNIRNRCALIGFTAECVTAPNKGCIWHITQRDENESGSRG